MCVVKFRFWSRSISLLALALFCLTGCGGEKGEEKPTGSIEGAVTVKKTAVTEGEIHFYSLETGGSGKSEIDSSGKFKIDSLEVGTYKVWMTPPPQGRPEMGKPEPKMNKSKIPKKFQSEDTSGITFEVKEGENSKDFDLK